MGIGPVTSDPVRSAVSIIVLELSSTILWSKARMITRIFCLSLAVAFLVSFFPFSGARMDSFLAAASFLGVAGFLAAGAFLGAFSAAGFLAADFFAAGFLSSDIGIGVRR